MGIVAGLDSSAEYTSIVVCDTETGAVVRHGHAEHPGERDDPQSWLRSLGTAAGGGQLADVQAIGVSAQQQGLVALDGTGEPVGAALLGNDQRVQTAAADLVEAFGGRAAWGGGRRQRPAGRAPRCPSCAGWPANSGRRARRTAEAMQPHDWLVWQLLGRPARRVTDRGDASGTGYWSAATESYRPDLVELALGHQVGLPEVAGPAEPAGHTPEGLLISAGTGQTMAAAFGLGLGPGDVVISLGATGGSVCAVHHEALADPSGTITSYADATGRHLPVVRTLNATRVLRGAAGMLGTDLEGLSELALSSTPGSSGLVLLPYLEGEQTPQLPHTAGSLHGLRRESMRPEFLARAAVEGMLCGLADALEVLRARGVPVRRVFLLGQAAGLGAVREAAPALLDAQVVVPEPADYAAIGAARQAAWARSPAPAVRRRSGPPRPARCSRRASSGPSGRRCGSSTPQCARRCIRGRWESDPRGTRAPRAPARHRCAGSGRSGAGAGSGRSGARTGDGCPAARVEGRSCGHRDRPKPEAAPYRTLVRSITCALRSPDLTDRGNPCADPPPPRPAASVPAADRASRAAATRADERHAVSAHSERRHHRQRWCRSRRHRLHPAPRQPHAGGLGGAGGVQHRCRLPGRADRGRGGPRHPRGRLRPRAVLLGPRGRPVRRTLADHAHHQ